MLAQEKITISVIDTALRFPQRAGMLGHDEILAELVRQLDARMIKAKDVAIKLAIAPARVTEMRKGERRLQPREMPIVAAMLGMSEQPQALKAVRSVQIPHLGKVAQGVWLEQSYADPENQEYVAYDMEPGDPGPDQLFSVTPEGLSMNLIFPPGIKLICRRVPFGFGQFKSGDLVIVERMAHDLCEMTCKQVVIDDDGIFWLRSRSDQPQFQEPIRIGKPNNGHHLDTEIRIIGKVIRGVIDYGV